MESKDLMIGDWVNYHGIFNKIAPADFCHKEWLEEIKPIPLTPEILEKNGFSDKYAEDDLSYATDYCGEVIGVHICGKCGIMDEMYFKYVHEIQHALHLCGIEKEIAL